MHSCFKTNSKIYEKNLNLKTNNTKVDMNNVNAFKPKLKKVNSSFSTT